MEELLNIKPGSIEDIIGAISPAVYENLKQAVEIRKWSNGVMLSKTQVEYCMQLIILYESKYVSDDEKIALKQFAQLVGLAYQVRDDIIDITSTEAELGKPAGSDIAANKSTYPSLLGLAGAQQKADDLYHEALQALSTLPYNTQSLADFVTFIVKRTS